MMLIERRKFMTGLVALIAAPAVVRAASLMPVRGVVMDAYGRSPMMDVLRYFRTSTRIVFGAEQASEIKLSGSVDGIHWMAVDAVVTKIGDGCSFSVQLPDYAACPRAAADLRCVAISQ